MYIAKIYSKFINLNNNKWSFDCIIITAENKKILIAKCKDHCKNQLIIAKDWIIEKQKIVYELNNNVKAKITYKKLSKVKKKRIESFEKYEYNNEAN